MLLFLKNRSYEIVRLFLNQIAISIFGVALALATGTNQPGLRIGTSVFSILFYLFITYVMVWELGYKDSHKIERGDEGQNRATGLFMGLVASTLNFLWAILIMLGNLIPLAFFGNVGAAAKVIALLTEGMYMGILSIQVGETALNTVWFMYFLLPIPLILTTSLAYFAGSKDFKIFGKR